MARVAKGPGRSLALSRNPSALSVKISLNLSRQHEKVRVGYEVRLDAAVAAGRYDSQLRVSNQRGENFKNGIDSVGNADFAMRVACDVGYVLVGPSIFPEQPQREWK